MNRYLVLLRGVNVGGKGRLPMADLRAHLQHMGFADVATYIASGNVIVASSKTPAQVKVDIETALQHFGLTPENKVLVLTRQQLQAAIDNKPKGFGEQPDTYHSDAIFLIDTDDAAAMAVFDPRPGVDRVWQGRGVIYSQRLSEQRTKSRLNKAISSPLYKSMTIRSWNTTTKLLELLTRTNN